MRWLPLIFVLTLLLAGCQSETPPDVTAPADTTRTPSSPDARHTPGVPLSEIVDAALSGQDTTALNRLGTPDSLTTAPHMNRHVPGQTDTLRTYFFDGARLTVYDVSNSPDRFVTQVHVTSPAYATRDSLHVGSPWSAVTGTRGASDRQDGDVHIYELGEPIAAPNLLRFTVEADTVRQMTWSFYVD